MQKGLRTQNHIVAKAAALFNTHGFAGTSMSDLLAATGLQKGGLYNHYDSKEALALAAFDYAVGQFRERYADIVRGQTNTIDCLHAICAVMLRNYEDPVVAGGCVVFNTAIEADDAYPSLKLRAREAMNDLLHFISVQVKLGQRSGEIVATVDPSTVATVLIAIYEGALGLSKLFDDAAHINRASQHMQAYVESLKT